MALTWLQCFTPAHRVPGLVPCFSARARAEAGEVGKNISLLPCRPLSPVSFSQSSKKGYLYLGQFHGQGAHLSYFHV